MPFGKFTVSFHLSCLSIETYKPIWKAKSKATGQIVQVQRLYEPFSSLTDARRTFCEIAILKALGKHDNIVQLLEVFRSDDNKHLYTVMEYMGKAGLHPLLHRLIDF
jgi:serine/threonine protein kinase